MKRSRFQESKLSLSCKTCGERFEGRIQDKWKKFCKKCFVSKYQKKSSRNNGIFYSKKAVNWLETISEKEKINIQHAENGGEYSFCMNGRKIFFDGYCKKTNTVYEFHGDYWHGNPEMYKEDDINKKTRKTFGELYRETMERENYIRKMGFNLITIWENKFDILSEM